MQTDDLAAQMVREMGLDSWFIQDEIERCEAIARRYIKKALTAQVEEIERLRKLTHGQWFYPPDNYDQELCMWSVDEVIDYCDLEPGHHVIEVNVATSLPSIWCTVHVTNDEDADERFTFTEYSTEAQARAALKAVQEVERG